MSLSRRSVAGLSVFIMLLFSTIIMDFPVQTIATIGNFLVVQNDLRPADVIHVIAGDDYRTTYAIQLYKQGYARMLFFTGGWCQYHGYYHGAHALQLALEAGIPQHAIAYDDSTVTSTYDEALLLNKFILGNQAAYHTVIVVSDPYHMRRSQWTYRHIIGKGLSVLMAPVPFDRTPFKQQWWTDSASTSYVKEEYQKLIYYFFRYQLNLKWLAGLDKY